jgi:hypothetical protein
MERKTEQSGDHDEPCVKRMDIEGKDRATEINAAKIEERKTSKKK